MLNRIIVVLAFIVAFTGFASASGVVGQSVLYRYDSSHIYPAILTHDNGDGSWYLVCLDPDGNGTNFAMGPNSQWAYASIAVIAFEDDSGTGDNRWYPNPAIGLGATGPQGPTGAQGSTGATGATGATGPAGQGAFVTSTVTPTLAMNGSAVQLDATHDTEYTASISIGMTLSLSGGQAGHVDFVCDSSSTPTTIVATVGDSNTGTVVVGVSLTRTPIMELHYRAHAGDFCKITSTNDTGTPTYSIIRQVLQVLG